MADEEDNEFQKKLLSQLLFYWLPEVRTEFLNDISSFINKHPQPNFFKSIYIVYFIQHELQNYKSNGKKELNSKDELQVVKAYFAYIDKFSSEFNVDLESISPTDNYVYQKMFWPFVIKQFDFNEKIDPIYQHLRAALFLEYFWVNQEYRPYVENYLKLYNKEAIWNLMMDIMNVIQVGLNKRTDGSDLYQFAIKETPGYTEIMDNLCIDVNEYKANKELQQDFLGIRQKPLIKINNDTYIVLSWKFFYNSVYLGTVFDFKNRSGIENKINYNTFKSIVGSEVSERVIFKGIMQYAFQKQHVTIQFSDDSNEGLPDCYLRMGKYILLFEFKDYLMPTKVICSNSFDTIKKHIDDNFVSNSKNQSKGITQLYNQIVKLNEGGFAFDRYEDKKLKKRNLVIIPVIVTTAYHFEMPGINSYLAEILEKKISSERTPFEFAKIVPLTMIDFSFLYRHFNRIKKKEVSLIDLILNYHEKIKTPTRNPHSKHLAFESSLPKKIRSKGPSQKEPDFIAALFTALNINPEKTNKKSA